MTGAECGARGSGTRPSRWPSSTASSAPTPHGRRLGPLHDGDGLGHAHNDHHGLLAALIRPIFNADSQAQARDRLSEAVAHLDGRLGKVAGMPEDAGPDILAVYAFPPDHRRKLRSTNPLERSNKEIRRRTDVVASALTDTPRRAPPNRPDAGPARGQRRWRHSVL